MRLLQHLVPLEPLPDIGFGVPLEELCQTQAVSQVVPGDEAFAAEVKGRVAGRWVFVDQREDFTQFDFH